MDRRKEGRKVRRKEGKKVFGVFVRPISQKYGVKLPDFASSYFYLAMILTGPNESGITLKRFFKCFISSALLFRYKTWSI